MRLSSFLVLFPFAIGLVFSHIAVAATAEDGAAAFRRGEYALAVEIWRELAEKGEVKAQFFLSMAYEDGKGVPRSLTESIKWLQRAAEQGDIGSQFALGSRYMAGKGVKQDNAEAVKWMKRAAEQGDYVSQAALGGAYAQGLGVQQDHIEALKWLTIAQAKKSFMEKQIQTNINLLLGVMTAAQIAEAKQRADQWKPKSEADR